MNGEEVNILITNIGRRGYLTDYLKRNPHFRGKVFASDCDSTASGLYGNNDGHFILVKPVEDERRYCDQLLDLCNKQDIKVVIPVIDPEIDILSRYRDEFWNHGIKVVVSDKRVLDICWNKLRMNDFLKECGVLYPNTYSEISSFEEALYRSEIDFPVIIKPIYGSGSVNTQIITDINQLRSCFKDGMMIQQFLSGAVEYGSDTFNSFSGDPLRVVVKRKISMRSGETDKAITVHKPEVLQLLLKISNELKHIGNLDTDILEYDGKLYVIDMNPRFGGGYPATHIAGVDLLDLIVQQMNGKTIQPLFDNYPPNLLVMKTIGTVSVQLS